MNKTIPMPTPITIHSRADMEAVLENIVQLQLARAELEAAQERAVTAVREKYREELEQIDGFLQLETSWAEAWARQNPDVFSEKKSLEFTHATIGFRQHPMKVERLSKDCPWPKLAERLTQLPWGERYLRQPPQEIDKEAILAARAELTPAQLRQAGIKLVQEERFYISPHRTATTPKLTQHYAPVWQEAA